MAQVNRKASDILGKLEKLRQKTLIGKAYPIGEGFSIFTGSGKSFKARGVVTGKAIAFYKDGYWRVIQG